MTPETCTAAKLSAAVVGLAASGAVPAVRCCRGVDLKEPFLWEAETRRRTSRNNVEEDDAAGSPENHRTAHVRMAKSTAGFESCNPRDIGLNSKANSCPFYF